MSLHSFNDPSIVPQPRHLEQISMKIQWVVFRSSDNLTIDSLARIPEKDERLKLWVLYTDGYEGAACFFSKKIIYCCAEPHKCNTWPFAPVCFSEDF